jgi:hypothetical protein
MTTDKTDLRLGYKLALQQIVSDPELLLQFCALERCGVQEGFVKLNKRIVELEEELKAK